MGVGACQCGCDTMSGRPIKSSLVITHKQGFADNHTTSYDSAIVSQPYNCPIPVPLLAQAGVACNEGPIDKLAIFFS